MTTTEATEPVLISLTAQKGGPGKSTTAMNTAACLSRTLEVAVVDVDPQESSTDWAELAGDNLPFDFAPTVDVADLTRLKKLPYDVILVDTPGSLQDTDVLDAVLDISDFVILPMFPEYMNVKPLKRTIREHVEPRGLDFRILLNKIDMSVRGELEDWTAYVDQVLKYPRFKQHIRKSKAITDGPMKGTVVTQYPDNRQHINAINDYTVYTAELRQIIDDIIRKRGEH